MRILRLWHRCGWEVCILWDMTQRRWVGHQNLTARIELHAVCLRNRGSIPGKVNSFYTYVRMTNEMHTFSHYFIPIRISSTCLEQIIVHHQEVTSVHAAYSIYHAPMGCLAANTMWLGLWECNVQLFFSSLKGPNRLYGYLVHFFRWIRRPVCEDDSWFPT
jgi:hypothetical protein